MVRESRDPGLDALKARDVRELLLDLGSKPPAITLGQVELDGEPAILPPRPPTADHDPVLDHDRSDPATSALLDVLRMLIVDREAAVLPAEEIGVEVAEHPHLAPRRKPRSLPSGSQHHLVTDPDLLDLLRDRLEASPDVAERQPRPIGEIAIGRGT